jgi:hypothetical protein
LRRFGWTLASLQNGTAWAPAEFGMSDFRELQTVQRLIKSRLASFSHPSSWQIVAVEGNKAQKFTAGREEISLSVRAMCGHHQSSACRTSVWFAWNTLRTAQRPR